MPFQEIACYHHPQDVAAFEEHYERVHAPLARTLPGLRRFTSVRLKPATDGTAPEFHRIVVVEFDDEAAYVAAASSRVGEQLDEDMKSFARAGVTVHRGRSTDLSDSPTPAAHTPHR